MTISRYNINETLFLSESCRWVHLLLTTDNIPPYQMQQFQHQPDKVQQQDLAKKKNKAKKKAKINTKNHNKIQIKVHKCEKCNHPRIISTVITHKKDSKYGIIYYITKIGVGDDIIFPIPVNAVDTMHKLD